MEREPDSPKAASHAAASLAEANRERRDIVTGEVMDEALLIRFVAGPGGEVTPDLARKLPGRGIWVAADRVSVATAARKGLFSRAAKAKLFFLPPYSPDLNPIENLWADLARRVEKFQCETMEELQDIAADEWKKTPKKLLRKLARSMPDRCQAVIEANGDHTKY